MDNYVLSMYLGDCLYLYIGLVLSIIKVWIRDHGCI